jgi:hypothetical protein
MRTHGVFSIPVPGPAVWIVLRSAFPYVSVCANRRKESRTVGSMLFMFAEDLKRMSPAGTRGGKCRRERYLDKVTKYVHFSAVSFLVSPLSESLLSTVFIFSPTSMIWLSKS